MKGILLVCMILATYKSCASTMSSQWYRRKGMIRQKWSDIAGSGGPTVGTKDQIVNCGVLCSRKEDCNSFQAYNGKCWFGYVGIIKCLHNFQMVSS